VALALLLLPALPGMALAQESVTVQLEPMGGSGVSGSATLTAAGEGTNVALDVSGLPPGATARGTLQAGTCATPSASFAALPDLTADASGRATATGSVLFRATENVALATMADGEHIIAIHTEQVVACGVIPRLASAAPAPGTLPATGGAASWLLAAAAGVLGLCALSGGLVLLSHQPHHPHRRLQHLLYRDAFPVGVGYADVARPEDDSGDARPLPQVDGVAGVAGDLALPYVAPQGRAQGRPRLAGPGVAGGQLVAGHHVLHLQLDAGVGAHLLAGDRHLPGAGGAQAAL
jgi:hypothetical protein